MQCVLGALHATLPAFASSASHIYARKVIMPLSPYNANFVLTKTILLLDLICMHTYLRDLKAISRIWWKWWLMYWIHVTFERERVWLATAKMQYIHAAYYIAIVLQFLAMIIVVGTHTLTPSLRLVCICARAPPSERMCENFQLTRRVATIIATESATGIFNLLQLLRQNKQKTTPRIAK